MQNPKPQRPLTWWRYGWLWTMLVGSVLGITACAYALTYMVVAPAFMAFTMIMFVVSGAMAVVGLWPQDLIYRIQDASHGLSTFVTIPFLIAVLLFVLNVGWGSAIA